MAIKQFLSDETIFYTDDLDGSFGDKVLATANAVASGGGGGASGMLLTLSEVGDDTVLDKNYKEIKAAIDSGIAPFYLKDAGIPDADAKEVYGASMYGVFSGDYTVLFSPRSGPAEAFVSDSDEGVLTLSK